MCWVAAMASGWREAPSTRRRMASTWRHAIVARTPLDAVVQTMPEKGTLLEAPSDAKSTFGPTWPNLSATALAPKSGEHDVHVAPVAVAPSIATTASPTFAT